MAILLSAFQCANIYLHCATHTLELEWLHFAGGEVFREVNLRALALARQHHATQWLANNHRMRIIREADQHWLTTVMLPHLTALGLERAAIVHCVDPLAQTAITAVLTTMLPLVQPPLVGLFPDKPAALAWPGYAAAGAGGARHQVVGGSHAPTLFAAGQTAPAGGEPAHPAITTATGRGQIGGREVASGLLLIYIAIARAAAPPLGYGAR